MTASSSTLLRCTCGNVEYSVLGAPILVAACYCDDCQAGARQIEALPNAASVAGCDGGTEYVLYRKDRVSCVRGAELLQSHRLTPDSPTSRIVATCCNAALFADFEKGHWYSVYRARLAGDAPALQMRIQTRYKPDGVDLPDDVPAYGVYPLKFIVKLIAARIAMLTLRRRGYRQC